MLAFHTYQNYLGPKIRGEEIAEYMGAIYTHKYSEVRERGDVNIHVKPKSLEMVEDGDWVDISDGEWVLPLLKERPKVNAIAGSMFSYKLFQQKIPNKMVWISQQHLNWERERKKVFGKVCGYIGGPTTQSLAFYSKLGEDLRAAGYEFKTCFGFVTKQDAIDFYKSIDVLIATNHKDDTIYKTPTKLINAASFGIPSIVYPCRGYEEWDGSYIPAKTTEEVVVALNNLEHDPEELMEASEFFHISNVAKRYEKLADIYQG